MGLPVNKDVQTGQKPQEQVENPKVSELKKQIEEERKAKLGLIIGMKKLKHKLAYKQTEFETFSKLIEANKGKLKSIGYLKRQKEKLEFRISTEASTLDSEKELIRKIKAIDEELEKVLKSYRVKRKVELISNDIEELKKEISMQEEKIKQCNQKLGELYSYLRALTGQRQQKAKREARNELQKTISLEDIAVMKKGKDEKADNTYIDAN